MTETSIDATDMRAQRRADHYTLSFTDEGGNKVVARIPHGTFEKNTDRFVSDRLRTIMEESTDAHQEAIRLLSQLADRISGGSSHEQEGDAQVLTA